jgi:hypothetical protein
MARILLLLVSATFPFQAQGPKNAKGAPERAAVDAAIDKGLMYLRPKIDPASDRVELILWTFIHAGIKESDPDFQRMLKAVLERKLEKVYGVALQAMIFEELDRVRYQGRIQQCAQYLVDNQCKNGQWIYGEPSVFVAPVPTGGKDVASASTKPPTGERSERKKPKVVRKVAVKKMKEGPATGDSSNSQYAALGLRACQDAGVLIPRDVIELARKAWRDSTHGNEGTKESGETRGWGYYGGTFKGSYGAMTAGGLASLCVYQSLLGEPWVKDPTIEAARNWITINFAVKEDPQAVRGWEGYKPTSALYYYLYALERAGILYGSETFGTHPWYSEGARFILDSQRSDGSWDTPGVQDDSGQVANTCFAILFLRRATQPLSPVASEDRYIKKSPDGK